MTTTVIPSDFKLPIAIGGLGLVCTQLGNLAVGVVLSIVGLLLAFQATRVAFEFDDEVSTSCETLIRYCMLEHISKRETDSSNQ